MSSNEKFTSQQWAAMQGGHEMPVEKENKFSFITELSESKLMRSKSAISRYNARDAADIVFLYSIILVVFKNDFRYASAAATYARKTLANGNFSSFRSSGTDLYMAASVVRDGSTLRKLVDDEVASDALFKNLRFDVMMFKKFMMNVVGTKLDRNFDNSYLFKLERQLKIDNPQYKAVRRMGADWNNLSSQQRISVVTRLLQALRARFPMSELRPILANFAKERRYIDTDAVDMEKQQPSSSNISNRKKHSNAKRFMLYPALGAAAGFAAGRFLK